MKTLMLIFCIEVVKSPYNFCTNWSPHDSW